MASWLISGISLAFRPLHHRLLITNENKIVMKTRIYFLDNLRTFLIFLVVLYHAGFTYQSAMESNWIVVDTARSDAIGLVGLYLDIFIMAVMFFISGYFIPISLKNNSSWSYVKSKFKRIMIP